MEGKESRGRENKLINRFGRREGKQACEKGRNGEEILSYLRYEGREGGMEGRYEGRMERKFRFAYNVTIIELK